MNEFKIGQFVKPRLGTQYHCIIIAFYSDGVYTTQRSEFVVVVSRDNLLTPPATLHYSLLEQVAEPSAEISVH